MNKQLVFIDDSGDPGFKSTSSNSFIMAAALFIDPLVAISLSKRISEYREYLGWRDDYEFKFTRIRKDIVLELLNIVSNYNFQIYAVYINKKDFKPTTQIIDKEKLYNWTIKELLSIMPLSDAKVEIDGRSSKENMRRTAAYLRRELNQDSIKRVKIKFEDSTKDNLIQLADLIAGSINRYISKEKTDSRLYYSVLRSKIVKLKRIS